MLNVVFYKPGSSYVNLHGKSHMGAVVFTFHVNSETYACPLWVARDDLHKPMDQEWLRDMAIHAFAGIIEHVLADDLICVSPTLKEIENDTETEESGLDVES